MSNICEIKKSTYDAGYILMEDQNQKCYLYQHIHNDREDRAVEWINTFHSTYLDNNKNELLSVLWEAVKKNMNNVIDLLTTKGLVTDSQIDKYKTDWETLKLLSASQINNNHYS